VQPFRVRGVHRNGVRRVIGIPILEPPHVLRGIQTGEVGESGHTSCEGGILTMRSKRSYFWMLSVLLALPLAAIAAPAAQNQGGGQGGYGGQGGGGGRRGPMSPDDRLKQMTKEFNLTADQQTKIKPILTDEQKKMEDIRNDSSGDRQSMRGKMIQVQQDTNTQVRALLDEKQQAKFDKIQQEREARMQNHHGGGPGGPGGPGDDSGGAPPPPQN
jgi:Spy/CpxP family protein refolding chaperone